MSTWLTYLEHLLGAALTSQDRAVIKAAGYGRERGLGRRPALVLVDFQRAYLGADRPVLDQLGEWPTGGGAAAWQALRAALPLLAAARESGVPTVLTRIAYPPGHEGGSVFVAKRGASSTFVEGQPGTELASTLGQDSRDVVVTKQAASALFGTGLEERLARLEVDTLVVAGLSTSGCVRATVVDAASHGYRVAVVPEACADRLALSHGVSLLDLCMKYADLLPADQARAYLGAPDQYMADVEAL